MAKDDSGFAEIEEYSKKLNSNPESLVFVPLAEAYRKSGMLDEAIETCLKGLQIHPSYMSARMVLGRAYMEKKTYEEAATEFKKVASADVNNIMAHSLLGQNYLLQTKYADAIKEFQKVLALNPDDGNAQQMLAKALELAKNNAPKPEAAAPTPAPPAAKASADAERDKKQNLTRAEEFSRQGDVDNAVKLYQLILEADPENLVVRQRLKDLEVKKAKASTERKAPERPRADAGGTARDNDKITSDDILSVMKDTVPRAAASSPAPAKTVKVDAGPVSGESVPALAKLQQTEGIMGTMLMDLQGTVISSALQIKTDVKELVAAVSLIFTKTEKSVQVMHYGQQVNQILITGEHGQIIFSKIGSKILVVLANDNINLGKMRLAMSEVVKALR
jgi:tetratricopeptide (TPR) repeat protein